MLSDRYPINLNLVFHYKETCRSILSFLGELMLGNTKISYVRKHHGFLEYPITFLLGNSLLSFQSTF